MLEFNTPAPRWGTANLNRFATSPYPRITPENPYRRVSAYPGTIPAHPGTNPAETGEMTGETGKRPRTRTKMEQKGTKMKPKGSQKGVQKGANN